MKELSQEQVFEIINNNAQSLNKSEREYGQICHFFEDHPNIDFDYIQTRAKENGYNVKRACDINSEDPQFMKAWNEENAIIIFWGNESNL